MNTKSCSVALVVLCLAGCTASTAVPPQIPKDATRADLSDSPTNYIHLDTQPAKRGPQVQGTYYTRVVGRWVPKALDNAGKLQDVAIGKPDYDKDQRAFIERLLAGKNRSFTLIASLSVDSRLEYKATVPLYSVSHVSDGSGESFDVNLKDSWVSPLIRVTADTRLTTELQAKRTQEVKTGAVSAALRIAQVATEQLAPAGKVLTTLNQDQVKKEAKVWDTAISQLFGQSASETRGGTALTATWSHDKAALVSLEAPNISDAMMPAQFIGSWVFEVKEVRMSLFSNNACLRTALDSACATKVLNALTPTMVLNELVAEKTTLAASLRKQDWYTTMVNTVISDAKSAGQFCRQVVQSADDLGFTAVDAKLTLWALQRGEPLAEDVTDAIAGNRDCADLIRPFSFTTPTTEYKVETADPETGLVQ